MPAGLIADIYDEFSFALENDRNSLLDFFTKNALVFNNLKAFSDKNDLNFYIVLTSWYADSLNNKDRYNDTFELTNRVLPIIESEIIRLNAFELKNEWYYYILFLKGTSTYNLRDFKTATLIFKCLVESDPQNEKYRNWLRHSLYRRKEWINSSISIVGVIFVFAGFIIGFFTKIYFIKQIFPAIGVILLIGNYIYEFYIKRRLKKKLLR